VPGRVSASAPTSVLLVGGGGHASDVLQAIEAANRVAPAWRVVGILDDGDVDVGRFLGRGVDRVGTIDEIERFDARFVLCLGWPDARRTVAARIGDRSAVAPPVVHPSADVGVGVDLGGGSVVLGTAHVSPMVRLGIHSLVSYGATIGHDVGFGSYATVMPGASVGGDVAAGDGVLVGSGAVVLEGLRLGDGARIGAGAVVTHDVDDGATVVGVPARPLS